MSLVRLFLPLLPTTRTVRPCEHVCLTTVLRTASSTAHHHVHALTFPPDRGLFVCDRSLHPVSCSQHTHYLPRHPANCFYGCLSGTTRR
ncbi:hypothetical protein BDU57DRAFT_511900 [Ampelomyces quisqualis]|uniref:Secreted protein n=1 Tax=Ampelomyces quisqualis TaxID=50730 RepID=A0A6A5QUF2_AMPQU|nr:hypothetical protein BDU57DRAFT_511900 [Ampelomyces quisqualis]